MASGNISENNTVKGFRKLQRSKKAVRVIPNEFQTNVKDVEINSRAFEIFRL